MKRLSLANARLETIARKEADLYAQFLELTDLREQLSFADLQNATRARTPAPVIIALAA